MLPENVDEKNCGSGEKILLNGKRKTQEYGKIAGVSQKKKKLQRTKRIKK